MEIITWLPVMIYLYNMNMKELHLIACMYSVCLHYIYINDMPLKFQAYSTEEDLLFTWW